MIKEIYGEFKIGIYNILNKYYNMNTYRLIKKHRCQVITNIYLSCFCIFILLI